MTPADIDRLCDEIEAVSRDVRAALVAASRESNGLRSIVRRWVIRRTYDRTDKHYYNRCSVCRERWPWDRGGENPEKHEPGCLAAPEPTLSIATKRADDAEQERDAALARLGELNAKWLAAIPACDVVYGMHGDMRSCDKPSTQGPQDEPGESGERYWCDDHAPRGRDVMACDYPEDLPWADLVRAGTGANE